MGVGHEIHISRDAAKNRPKKSETAQSYPFMIVYFTHIFASGISIQRSRPSGGRSDSISICKVMTHHQSRILYLPMLYDPITLNHTPPTLTYFHNHTF